MPQSANLRSFDEAVAMVKTFQAFIDGSGTGDPDLLVLAGFIAPTSTWTDFTKEWQIKLDQANLRRFKMNEMASRPEVAGYFYRTIEEQKITAAISCTVRTAELRKAVKEFNWPAEIVETRSIENPYFFAFKAVIDILSQHQAGLGIDEPVDFIFDDESEKSKLDGIWDMIRLSSAPQFRKNLGKEPVFQNDEKVPPLQAADLYAWWVRKWCRESVSDWGAVLPFPLGKKRDIRRLHMEFGENDFIAEFENGLKPQARARWGITDPAAALRELERLENGVKMTFPDPTSKAP